jgi:DNA-binding NtrC family response regulator
VARDGRLVHRQAEFIPIGRSEKRAGTDDSVRQRGVLAMLAAEDMSHQELASEFATGASADDLHRAIRRFRRDQAGRYALEAVLGNSSAMKKVDAQIAAAAASRANTLVIGRDGSGCAIVARAIHYKAAGDSPAKLVPVDCEMLTDELLRRTLDAVGSPVGNHATGPTLLLENIEALPATHQAHLLASIQQSALPARIIATCSTPVSQLSENLSTSLSSSASSSKPQTGNDEPSLLIPALVDAISTITIELPRLVDRIEDLPLLAQFCLEACNRRSAKQVGSLRADALDLLTLYSWPGETEQLKQVIAAAHEACTTHQIVPSDLPAVIHHAATAATHVRREPERVDLEKLLATIEKEAIARALAQSRGNKSEAAELLGMTRPRFYRRLVQLGLAESAGDSPAEQPEFVEREPDA